MTYQHPMSPDAKKLEPIQQKL